ncbi:tRNA wybutosine-synthesizing protein 2 [Blattella germanica]|nr:tRNA wybutosine-synthesizing protein 2 [Blattella germanica]
MAVYLRLKQKIQDLMLSKNKWEDNLIDEIPRSWEKYGDMVLIDKNRFLKDSVWKDVECELWPIICEVLNVERIAFKSIINSDGFRTPNTELIWGQSPWIKCLDNGITYTWDLTKSMFCAGNASERHRIAKLNCDGEVVVDLYAGIGYFTLPYLVHSKAQLVYACEWNPNAVIALKKNIVMNNVADRCIVIEGDNQSAGLQDIADRINCGLLPSSRPGWVLACKAIKTMSGGMLHIHENVSCKKDKRKIWAMEVSQSILQILQEVKSHKTRWEVSVLGIHRVKSYAPHVDHLVLDLKCKPTVDC